jgi:DNA repair protein RecO (recombination protein O)
VSAFAALHRPPPPLHLAAASSRRPYISNVSLVSTPAVVLRTYRYSETSKIVRLATRDFGVQSAIAKGVLRPRSPFGAALETLSEGVAQLYHRETRELQTLAAFDVVQLRRDLANDLGRFAGAAALSEVMLKMAPPAPLPAAYEAFLLGLDALVTAEPGQADAVAVRWLWLLVGVLGFAPQLEACVRDGNPVAGTVAFDIAEGGVLCAKCAAAQPPTKLPPQAYRDLVALNDPQSPIPNLDPLHAAAHRRLVARFVRHHLDETVRNGTAPKSSAIDLWERRAWAPTA